ncbi:MAG TPA: hypothetical protein VK174_06630 [Chitinophagales bacterium]|nr:hypothetical protein [Chitinophagales bacterium]
MKQLFTTVTLIFALACLTSFRPDEAASFSATLDGKPFQLKPDQLFRGIVMSKTGSMDGRTPTRTLISTTFNGPTYNATEGRLFNENIVIEINYEADKTGEPSFHAIAMQYESANYYNIKEQSKINVTGFVWESDKKHFSISAEFACKLRSWGAPADGKKDISLKGKMNNIRITVPSWVTAKN